MLRILAGSLFVVALFSPLGLHAAPLTAEKAVKLLNQEVQVQITVRSSKLHADRNEVVLNSHTSFRNPSNLAVVIHGRVVDWYSFQGIHDLPKFFFGKTIVVSGLVEQFADQTYILVRDPAQIQTLK